MAFPSTYNFNYYKGDTFEFKIYPKNSNGTAFDLTSYALSAVPPGDGAKFTIATARGSAGVTGKVVAQATISLSDNSITCTITPAISTSLLATSSYVYDVEISKGSGATVHTLLTGSISVTDQVTGATS
jgi:hypothetical protein